MLHLPSGPRSKYHMPLFSIVHHKLCANFELWKVNEKNISILVFVYVVINSFFIVSSRNSSWIYIFSLFFLWQNLLPFDSVINGVCKKTITNVYDHRIFEFTRVSIQKKKWWISIIIEQNKKKIKHKNKLFFNTSFCVLAGWWYSQRMKKKWCNFCEFYPNVPNMNIHFR